MRIKQYGVRRVLALAVVLLPASGLAQQTHPLLVTEDWLAERLGDPGFLLLNVEYDESTFLEAHIPGARFLPYQEIVTRAGERLVELPPLEQVVEVFRQAGISNDLHVVLYGTPIPTARAFVTLEHLGHERVSILDGGLFAWREAGRDVATGPVSGERGAFEPRPRNDVFGTRPGWTNVATRPDTPFSTAAPTTNTPAPTTGATAPTARATSPARGTSTGRSSWSRARNRASSRASGWRPSSARAGIDPDETVVSYCYIGMRASVNYFVSRLMGHETRFYDGSWNDWSLLGLPAETGPQRPRVEGEVRSAADG